MALTASAASPGPAIQGQLDLGFRQRDLDIAQIWDATGIYTAEPEIEDLLDRLGWPLDGGRLLDPGAGGGGFLVAALARLDLGRDDIGEAARRVRGYEFYPGAVREARRAVTDHLTARGWSAQAAWQAAAAIVEELDFLLDAVPAGEFDVIGTNPPYLRYANLPPEYQAEYKEIVPGYARHDLMYAYLERSARVIAPGGQLALVTADRWLLNDNAAELRARLGKVYSVTDARRLDPASAFYRPKRRRAGTPPRVHPVSLILTPGSAGRKLDARPFRLDPVPDVDGVPLSQIARIQLAPWLGPAGIFTVDSPAGLPADCLVPVVEPGDIDGDQIRPPRRWALVTREAEPPPAVLAHLDATLSRMPPKGRRRAMRWLPPEPFADRLPLNQDAVLVPRIAKQLRAVRLPAGRLPVNHQLVVLSGLPVPALIAMLSDPAVQGQADALARRVEGGYRSYTARLLRQLIIPRHHIAGATAALPA